MSRDHTKLRVFELADDLVVQIYRSTTRFPAAEKFGLVSQMRRAAVSVAANIVEGSARRTSKEYVQFLVNALGSASELRYLIGLSRRLELCDGNDAERLDPICRELVRSLQRLIDALESRSPQPGAPSHGR